MAEEIERTHPWRLVTSLACMLLGFGVILSVPAPYFMLGGLLLPPSMLWMILYRDDMRYVKIPMALFAVGIVILVIRGVSGYIPH